MNLNEYAPLALRTEKKLPTTIGRIKHAAIGLLTECGELNTVIKRVEIYGKSLDTTDGAGVSLRHHAGEEIADAMWYVAIGADVAGLTLGSFAPQPAEGELDPYLLGLELGSIVGRIADMSAYFTVHKTDELPDDARGFLQNALISTMQILGRMAQALDLEFGALLRANIDKLRARFPDAYSDAAAEARADKGGLDARNS